MDTSNTTPAPKKYTLTTKRINNEKLHSIVQMSRYIFDKLPKDQVLGLYRMAVDGFKVDLKTPEAVHVLQQKSSQDKEVEFHSPPPRENNTYPLVITNIDIFTTDEEIKQGNKDIQTVHRLHRSGRPIRKVKVTVNSQAKRDHYLHQGITLRWEYYQEHYPTESFIKMDRLVQCYKCQGFNHMAKTCKEKGRCGKCSAEDHITRECPVDTRTEPHKLKCALCGGNHRSSFFNCERRPPVNQHRAGTLTYAEVTALRQAKIPKVNSVEAMEVIEKTRNKQTTSTPNHRETHKNSPLLPLPGQPQPTMTNTQSEAQTHTPQPNNSQYETTVIKYIKSLEDKMIQMEETIQKLQNAHAILARTILTLKQTSTEKTPLKATKSDCPPPSVSMGETTANETSEDESAKKHRSRSGHHKKRPRTSSPQHKHE
jgi:hypothetical protein